MSVEPGLCAGCRHARVVRSRRGSTFWLCRLGEDDPSWPRYPPLPVRQCPRHEPGQPEDGG